MLKKEKNQNQKTQLASSFQTEEPKNKGVLLHQHDVKTSHLSKVGRGFNQACLFSINILSLKEYGKYSFPSYKSKVMLKCNLSAFSNNWNYFVILLSPFF